MMFKYALFLLSILFVVSVVTANEAAAGFDESSSSKPKSPEEFDYGIYELIERLNTFTPEHQTFYDLLKVTPSASSDEISRQFRRLGFQYHPDKSNGDERAKGMFNLYSGASQVLKGPMSRKRYEWILHEAPPWHRSQVYFLHKFQRQQRGNKNRKGSSGVELSLSGTLMLIISLLTFAQLLLQWVKFALNRYWIWSGAKALRSIPPNELRRMEKKAMKSDLTFLAYVDANFENMRAARTEPLPFPKPTDLFILSLPIAGFKFLFEKIKPKRA